MTSPASSIVTLLIIVVSSAILLKTLISNLPDLHEKDEISLPTNLDQLRHLQSILVKYQVKHPQAVVQLWASVFIFLQSFAIPGSVFLSVLSGSLFGFSKGLLYVCSASTIGSVICYLLSYYVGTPLIQKYIPDRVKQVKEMVDKQKPQGGGPWSILPYFLFLRITPLLPNWLVTLSAPHVGISLPVFVLGTFFGVMPVSTLHVSAGQALDSLQSSDLSILSPSRLLGIFAVGSIPLLLQKMMK